MTETLSEKNECIARFMGFEYHPYNKDTKRTHAHGWINGDTTLQLEPQNYLCRNTTDMKYDTSWDWLMPVVEKIEGEKVDGMMFHVDICTSGVLIEWCLRPTKQRAPKAIRTHFLPIVGKINQLHEAVYQFCKWRETQKK